MKIKKVGIIILSLAIGIVIGGISYKTYVKSSEKQDLEIQHIKENKNQEEQNKIKQVDKEENIDNEKISKEKEEEIKKKTKEERAEYYYKQIKDARQKQIEYINSFNDPDVKQSLQTSQSAAVGEATLLELKFPEDTDIIEANLKKVLDGK